ncbi:MAG: DUF2807 domain-containing protein [Acidimicrobiia bacterium]
MLPACGPTGSGELVTEDRDVGEFDSIEVSGGIELRLTVDPNLATSVTVTYDDNIIDRIVTEVDDSTLRIESRGSFSIFGGGGRFVEVSVASLQGLAASGGTEVTGEGASDVLDLNASGGTDVDLALLTVGEMTIRASCGADVTVNVSDSITVVASGGADVVIHGDPPGQSVGVSGGADVTNG